MKERRNVNASCNLGALNLGVIGFSRALEILFSSNLNTHSIKEQIKPKYPR
jgi:hypothetical protein